MEAEADSYIAHLDIKGETFEEVETKPDVNEADMDDHVLCIDDIAHEVEIQNDASNDEDDDVTWIEDVVLIEEVGEPVREIEIEEPRVPAIEPGKMNFFMNGLDHDDPLLAQSRLRPPGSKCWFYHA